MATLTVQSASRSGVAPTYAAAAGGGDDFLPGDNNFVHVKNASGGSITVTAAAVATVIGFTVTSPGVTLAAGTEKIMGPYPAYLFADPTDGRVKFTYSGVTSLTLGVFDLTQP